VASLAEQAHDHAITYYVAGQVTISWLLCRAWSSFGLLISA